jgi:hypothetical protein
MLESLTKVLLTTSIYNFTIQNNCEEKLWSKTISHFEQTPHQQFAFQGKCPDRESHLFKHSLQPKNFLGFPSHQDTIGSLPQKVMQEFTSKCIGVHTKGTFSNTIQFFSSFPYTTNCNIAKKEVLPMLVLAMLCSSIFHLCTYSYYIHEQITTLV